MPAVLRHRSFSSDIETTGRFGGDSHLSVIATNSVLRRVEVPFWVSRLDKRCPSSRSKPCLYPVVSAGSIHPDPSTRKVINGNWPIRKRQEQASRSDFSFGFRTDSSSMIRSSRKSYIALGAQKPQSRNNFILIGILTLFFPKPETPSQHAQRGSNRPVRMDVQRRHHG